MLKIANFCKLIDSVKSVLKSPRRITIIEVWMFVYKPIIMFFLDFDKASIKIDSRCLSLNILSYFSFYSSIL